MNKCKICSLDLFYFKSIKCPRATNLGGPIISLKANPNKNQLTVCWLSIDSSKLPIEHYEIVVNGEKKEKVKPLNGKHKVTLDGCVENVKYSILLVAIPKSNFSSRVKTI